MRKRRKSDSVKSAIERNLAEIVLPDLKGNDLDDSLDPMSRQNFDDLVSQVQVESSVEKCSNFFCQKVFGVFVFLAFVERERCREGGKVYEVVQLEIGQVVRDASVTVTHSEVVRRDSQVETDVNQVYAKSEDEETKYFDAKF